MGINAYQAFRMSFAIAALCKALLVILKEVKTDAVEFDCGPCILKPEATGCNISQMEDCGGFGVSPRRMIKTRLAM